MTITNQDKPTTSLTNITKVSIGETWASILTTWATETRTWLAISQLITNVALEDLGYFWSSRRFLWEGSEVWTLEVGGITNINKP